MLSEQSHCAVPIGVHQVHQRISVLAQTRCEDYQLEVLRHGFQKVVHAGSLGHENVANVPLDIYRNGVIWVLDLVELAVHQSLIEIQN